MKEMTLKAENSAITAVTEAAEELMEEIGMPMKAQLQLNVVIDELMANIVSYAYPEGEGSITVRFSREEDLFVLTFIDSGIPFNPLLREDPDITAPAEERSIGGLGIMMSKKFTDALEYRYENGQNILTAKKRI